MLKLITAVIMQNVPSKLFERFVKITQIKMSRLPCNFTSVAAAFLLEYKENKPTSLP
jgi:hypothetical protein